MDPPNCNSALTKVKSLLDKLKPGKNYESRSKTWKEFEKYGYLWINELFQLAIDDNYENRRDSRYQLGMIISSKKISEAKYSEMRDWILKEAFEGDLNSRSCKVAICLIRELRDDDISTLYSKIDILLGNEETMLRGITIALSGCASCQSEKYFYR